MVIYERITCWKLIWIQSAPPNISHLQFAQLITLDFLTTGKQITINVSTFLVLILKVLNDTTRLIWCAHHNLLIEGAILQVLVGHSPTVSVLYLSIEQFEVVGRGFRGYRLFMGLQQVGCIELALGTLGIGAAAFR